MVITLLLLWLMQVVFFDRIYKSIMIKELEKEASTLIAIKDDRIFSPNAEAIAKSNSSCITLYSHSQHRSLNISETSYKDCYLYSLRISDLVTLYEKALEAGGKLTYSFSFEDGNMYLEPFSVNSPDESHSVVHVRTFRTSDGENRAIFINRVISPVGASTRATLWILTVISMLYLVLSVILVIVVSRNITCPLVGINRSAKELEKGNYDAKYLQKVGYREVDELAHTLERASSELSKVEKLQKELIANVSHDLRTPLTLISGYSEMMRDIPGEANRENCQTIIDEVARLTSLVNDLLEMSKLQSGTQKLTPTEFSLTDMLSDCIYSYSQLTSAQGYRLTFEFDENVTVNADRTTVLQAVRNLINNALTYTGEDKTVKVVQEMQDGAFVRISVTDTGDGIEQSKLRDIWDRYYRDHEHRRAANGTGLGLSIVKSVMKMHGGRYGVRSKVGCGSTFWIEIPVK